jgi:hypothetical protein
MAEQRTFLSCFHPDKALSDILGRLYKRGVIAVDGVS